MPNLNIGDPAIGLQISPSPLPTPARPLPAIDQSQVLADFARRLQDMENAIKLSVPTDRITSAITLTKDTVLIQAEKIGILGEVTFADYLRDQNGIAIPGTIDPKITQIRGGVIRTGKIASFDGNSYIDLDAVTTGVFIKGQSSVSILANGNFTFGATSGKQLIWDGSDLRIGGSSLIAGQVGGGSYAANSLVSQTLSEAARVIDMQSANLFQKTSGAGGVFIGSSGIYGKRSSDGAVTFAINASTGAASFAGDITGSNGIFAGNISSGGYIYATGSLTVTGLPAASFIAAPSANNHGLVASIRSGSSSGKIAVYGESNQSGCPGVVGSGNVSGSVGVSAFGAGGATALEVLGSMTINNSTLVSNLNADTVQGQGSNLLYLSSSGVYAGEPLVGYIRVNTISNLGLVKIPYYV